MPRKKKNVHGSPATAGIRNMPENYESTHTDDLCTMEKILPVYNIGTENRQNYDGQYDEESLKTQIQNFFNYCAEHNVKPAKTGLSLWLGIDKSTYWEWETKPAKYGFKSKLIEQANSVIEWSYMSRVESYPTGNIFLLKAIHGVVETQKVEVTTQNTNPEDAKNLVNQLGLDKDDSAEED